MKRLLQFIAPVVFVIPLTMLDANGAEKTKSLVAVPDVPPAAKPAAPAGAKKIKPDHLSDEDRRLLELKERDERNIADKAFPLLTVKLPSDTVAICWENPTDANLKERGWVRNAQEVSWQKHSSLRFTGWKKCTDAHKGIRILIEDSGPHVKYLGKHLLGLKNGMVLNFTFNTWSQSCKNNEAKRELCIKSIAVHEFGHAIGFAHEQNRPDTPGECKEPAQGGDGNILMTPWDGQSVMNYCNETYNNDGSLSNFDILAVQTIYGQP